MRHYLKVKKRNESKKCKNAWEPGSGGTVLAKSRGPEFKLQYCQKNFLK
jgi:hypothetical protein